MPRPRYFMRKWKDLADRIDHLRKDVNIALVGKYTKLEDSYASIIKALQHASVQVGYRLNLTVRYFLLVCTTCCYHFCLSF